MTLLYTQVITNRINSVFLCGTLRFFKAVSCCYENLFATLVMSVVVCTYDFILLVAIFKDNLVYNVEELSSSENIVTLKYDFILIPVLVISGSLFQLNRVFLHPLLNDFTS